jgi:hypothetical protein
MAAFCAGHCQERGLRRFAVPMLIGIKRRPLPHMSRFTLMPLVM